MRKDIYLYLKEKEQTDVIPKEFMLGASMLASYLGFDLDEYLDHKNHFYMEDVAKGIKEQVYTGYRYFYNESNGFECWDKAKKFWRELLHNAYDVPNRRLYDMEDATRLVEKFLQKEIPYDLVETGIHNNSIVVSNRGKNTQVRKEQDVFYDWRNFTKHASGVFFKRAYVYTVIFDYIGYCMENGKTTLNAYISHIGNECDKLVSSEEYRDEIQLIEKPAPYFYYSNGSETFTIRCKRIGYDKETSKPRYKALDETLYHPTFKDGELALFGVLIICLLWIIGGGIIHYVFDVDWWGDVMCFWYCLLPAIGFVCSK